MKIGYLLTAALALALLTVGCANEPQTIEVEVEVTRLVEREVVVEVTQIVTQVSLVEVPVETTRLVVVTATPEPETATTTAEPMAVSPTSSPTPIATPMPTVQTAPPTATHTPPPVANVNLLPNPSFEEDWYFAGFNELQIPNGWQVATDEGANNLSPGSGGLFARPEIRVVPFSDLPPHEHSLFIFDGQKTLKAFKGYAPTSFSLFTDIHLEPGNYRLVIRYFPDTVDRYEGGEKIFATDPLAAEIRIIHNSGGTAWQGTTAGQRSILTYDFTVAHAGVNRVGASFRNRYGIINNGWFLDDWELRPR